MKTLFLPSGILPQTLRTIASDPLHIIINYCFFPGYTSVPEFRRRVEKGSEFTCFLFSVEGIQVVN